MALNAFKDGETILNEANLNELIAQQSFKLIYGGTQRDAKAGAGVTENNLANANLCTRFTLTGSTEISRVELEVDRDGDGSDLILQIRSGMVPGSGNDGTLLKEVTVPKEFIPETKSYWSVPINLTGLISGGQYWLVVPQGGDATDHLDWVGEAAQDANYPAYSRNGGTGNWTLGNALHFKVFSGNSGDLIHGIYGTGLQETYLYDIDNNLSQVYRYCPPYGETAGGIRDIITITFDGDYLLSGAVT